MTLLTRQEPSNGLACFPIGLLVHLDHSCWQHIIGTSHVHEIFLPVPSANFISILENTHNQTLFFFQDCNTQHNACLTYTGLCVRIICLIYTKINWAHSWHWRVLHQAMTLSFRRAELVGWILTNEFAGSKSPGPVQGGRRSVGANFSNIWR